MLHHADSHTTNDVDGQNQQTGNSIAFHELRGTVHGTVKIGFLGDFRTAMLGLVLIDQPGIQIGINRHLLARHGIQSEAGTDLRHPAGTFGDNQKVDDHKDGENHQTNSVVSPNQDFTKGLDDLTGSIAALMAVQQYNPGGRHVQAQAQQGGHQQYRGEGGKFHRPHGVHADQQNDDGQSDVEGEEHIQQERRHGQNHHAKQPHQHQGDAEVPPRQGFDVVKD